MANNPSNKVKTESIDEVILRLLGLNPGVEIDYQTYFEILKKKLSISRMGGKELPQEEDDLLRAELKRVKVIKEKGIRFKVKTAKTKVASQPSFGKSQRKISPGGGALVKYKKSTIVPRDISPVKVEDVTEKKEKSQFSEIRKTLSSILSILASKFKFEQKQADVERREKETSRRGGRESGLEGFKKGISGIVGLTKKVLSPFSNIIERIKKFLFFTLLGVAFNKFMNWLDDKENLKKFNNIVDFLIDHWPAIVGLYVLFGTSFGKLVRGLVKGILRTVIALTMNIPRILAFIKKNKKATLIGLGLGSLLTGYVSREVKNIFSDDKKPATGLEPKPTPELDQAKKSAERAQNTKVPTLNVGGMIPQVPSFNFGGLIPSIPGFAMGGMDLQSGVPITGAGKDDTLIAAKTGEAILTEKDQVDLSQRYVDRKTGQPLNIPQYLSGRKPGSVNMSNLRVGGFNVGGIVGGNSPIIPKFNVGGMIGGSSAIPYNDSGMEDDSKFNLGGIQNSLNFPPVNIASSSPIKGLRGSSSNLINPRAKVIFDRLVRGGLSKIAAAGIVSNIGVETGYTYDPNTFQKGGGPGRGLVQWESGGRFDTDNINLTSFAKSKNKPWNDLGTQVDFILHELNNHPEYQAVKYRINSAKDIASATRIFLSDYEKAGTPHIEDRLKVGQQLIQLGYLTPQPKPKRAPKRGRPSFSQLTPFSLIPSSLPFQRGGLVNESTGTNIKGATADRQLTALQPGEFVLPVDTVNRLGVPFLEKMVALTDSNSDAYLRKGVSKRPNITPYQTMGSSGMGGVMTLPPITQSASGNRARASGYGGGSQVPDFSVIAPSNDRSLNASIYGLIESTV